VLKRLRKFFRKKLLLVILLFAYLIFVVFIVSKAITGPKIISIDVRQNEIVGRESTIIVGRGDKLLFKISSDVSEDFHIEGYHLFGKLNPKEDLKLTLDAETPGKFPIFLDKSKKLIGYLIVN
jgi:hypothetical protein